MGPHLLRKPLSTIILHQTILQQEPATVFSAFADSVTVRMAVLQNPSNLQHTNSQYGA
jgi:hypothetical protein